MSNFFQTIEKPAVAEYKDRGSKFIGYAYPIGSIESFKGILKQLKEEHPKANHHCFAYRIGTDGNTFRSSDDGEPAGSAGKPILGQIDSKGLTNVAVIVVRYFGGTMLGVPGLIQAYKTCASYALQLAPLVQRPIMAPLTIEFDYTMMNDVMMLVRKYRCEVLKNETQLFCSMDIAVPKENLDYARDAFERLQGLHILK